MVEVNEIDQDDKNKRPPKKSHKKHILITLLVIVLMAVGIFVYEVKKLTGPAKGLITHSSEAINVDAKNTNFRPVEVKGSLVSFAYPQFMSVYPATQKPVYPVLETYEYSFYDIKTWLLTISITKLNSDSLNADSAYHADQLNPSVYSQSTVVDNSKTYIVMTDQSAIGFDDIAFSLSGGMSAEISLLGNDSLGTSNLQKTFTMVLDSFSWN